MMITMSVHSNGGGPPLPKRTTSQRLPRQTNPPLSKSQSADMPPPLPPHHPESNTIPRRSNKHEPQIPSRTNNAPDLPSRTGRKPLEEPQGIQRKNFETKSFVDRHTAKAFSDPAQFNNRSMKIRRSYDSHSTRPPAPLPNNTESSIKQSSRTERRLPPPPSTDSIPYTGGRSSVSDQDRPLPPPPDISSIPTGRRPSVSDEPLPPPPPIQSIPGKSHHIRVSVDSSDLPPPPPPSRQPSNTYHVKLQKVSDDTPPPLPPSRTRVPSSSSQSSQHGAANTHEYERRFVFHDESEFPEPEKFSGKKKEYPSQVINKRKTKPVNTIGAL